MTPGHAAGRRAALFASIAAAALLAAQPASAGSPRPLDLPPGSLETALTQLAGQTGDQLLYPPELVAGRTTAGLHGRYTPDAALATLLAETGLMAERIGPKVVVLRLRRPAAAAAVGVSAPAPPREPREPRPFGAEPPRPAAAANAPPGAVPPAAAEVSELRVTGTHLRGGATPASPLVVLDREALERTGQVTLAEALNDLPQAFGGLNTEATAALGADPQSANISYGTSLNLRGLGSNATLVLVNGRRVSGSGVSGDFADLSVLPAIAVSRVEVLLDGASAVYGSDAIGGVVNVLLRRDLEGGEIRASAGVGDGGAPAEYAFGMVGGRRWASGGVIGAYEAYRRDALSAQHQDFTASADLRPLGGSDWRATTAFPGNIVAVNPATGLSGPWYGIPAGQAGTALRPADFQPGAVNRLSRQLGQEVLPEQRRQNLFAAVDQEVGPDLELTGDVRYGFRIARAAMSPQTATLTVSRANPWFVSPDGRTSHQVQYSFRGELPNPTILSSAESLASSFGGRLRLPAHWAADSHLAFAQSLEETRTRGNVNTAILAEALGNVPDRPETAYGPARDGYFNPYTGVAANPPGLMSMLASAFSVARVKTQVLSANAQADGSLFALPAGALQLALGANARRETYSRKGSRYTSTTAFVHGVPVEGDRTVTAAFAEARAPLVGEANPRPGLARLELSGAVRAEWYSDFGHTLDPKVGVLWSPMADLNVRATFGQSFRAPSLSELLSATSVTPFNFAVPGGTVLSLGLQGGSASLTPETAQSWTAGVDYRPGWSPRTRISLTAFDADVRDRINRPINENFAGALTDPRFVNFVRRIDPLNNPADLAAVNALLGLPGATPSAALNPPTSYRAIVDLRAVNTGRLRVRGLDLDASQGLDVLGGDLVLRAAASRLFRYRQQLTPTAAVFDVVGQVGYPTKLRGRLSADWTRGPFAAGLAVNHAGALRAPSGDRLDPETMVDASLRLSPDRGPFEGVTVSLSVRNLFDAAPPFYDNPSGFAFDPANADVLRRFVTLRLSRRW
ncbi:TonB-dependent receptor [Phenylobacterium sp.]|jgi:outer membrane receptor protein involved in Fe transport|uniref:TonB-dependent receptor n=1 Tax=Phenylobacterium sp. TaxID=1871053 RepID=UPI002F9426BD